MNTILRPLYHYAGVYMIENTTNKKVYIGSSYDIEKRLDKHRNALKRGTHPCKALQEDFNRHHTLRANVLYVEAIPRGHRGVDRNKLYAIEWQFIEKYNAIENGYNQMPVSNIRRDAI